LEAGSEELDSILSEAQAAVALDRSGYPVKGLSRYFDALLARTYLNRPDPDSEFNPMGGIRRALHNRTLVFRGFELAHTLLALHARLNESSRLEELNVLIHQLVGFTLQKPLGTSHFDPNQKREERFGSLNATIWVRELYYMNKLWDEFPEVAAV
jgi:hypothetical protein